MTDEEFNRVYFECAKRFLMHQYRDWETISHDGKLRFTNETAALLYAGACRALGDSSEPDMEDDTVVVGGVEMSCSALQQLQQSFLGDT